MTTTDEHGLIHVEVHDTYGRRLVSACICGWWSPDGSHWRFERHLKAVSDDR